MSVTGWGRRRLIWVVVGVVAAVAALRLAGRRQGYGLPQGEPMPRLTLHDYRGRLYDSEVLRNRVVALLFWKVSVEASVAELKGLEELRDRYGGRGLDVIGIALDSKEGAYVRNFAQKQRVKIPLLIGDVETAHRFGGLRGVPTLYLFGRDGKMRERFEGFRSNEDLEKEILGLL